MARTKQSKPAAGGSLAAKTPRKQYANVSVRKTAPTAGGIPDVTTHEIASVRCVRDPGGKRGAFECEMSNNAPNVFSDLHTWHRCAVGFLVALRGEYDESCWVSVEELQILLWDKLLEVNRRYTPVKKRRTRADRAADLLPVEVMAVTKNMQDMYYIKVGARGKGLELCAVLENRLVLECGSSKYYSAYAPVAKRAKGTPPISVVNGAVDLLDKLRIAMKQLRHKTNGGAVNSTFPLGARSRHDDPVPESLRLENDCLVEVRAAHMANCLIAALLNALSSKHSDFAIEVNDLCRYKLGEWGAPSIKHLNSILRSPEVAEMEGFNGQFLIPAVPIELRQWNQRKLDGRRLEWLLAKEDNEFVNKGDYLVTLVTSAGTCTHCVAVVTSIMGERCIMDSEEEVALSLTKESLDRCCGRDLSCNGLNEIYRLGHISEATRRQRGQWTVETTDVDEPTNLFEIPSTPVVCDDEDEDTGEAISPANNEEDDDEAPPPIQEEDLAAAGVKGGGEESGGGSEVETEPDVNVKTAAQPVASIDSAICQEGPVSERVEGIAVGVPQASTAVPSATLATSSAELPCVATSGSAVAAAAGKSAVSPSLGVDGVRSRPPDETPRDLSQPIVKEAGNEEESGKIVDGDDGGTTGLATPCIDTSVTFGVRGRGAVKTSAGGAAKILVGVARPSVVGDSIGCTKGVRQEKATKRADNEAFVMAWLLGILDKVCHSILGKRGPPSGSSGGAAPKRSK